MKLPDDTPPWLSTAIDALLSSYSTIRVFARLLKLIRKDKAEQSSGDDIEVTATEVVKN